MRRRLATLTDDDLALLRGKNFAHFAVVDGDGWTQASPVWIDADDAGNILVNSAVGRLKDRNVRRDPRVAVSVHDQEDPYRYVSVQGTVVSIETGEEAEAHIDVLNQRYHDGERWTPKSEQRVIYRIRPDRIFRGD
jgi:PPOX class probable F420-dependent enzyme